MYWVFWKGQYITSLSFLAEFGTNGKIEGQCLSY